MTPVLYKHQEIGIEKLVKDPIVGLWDSMGLGKSRQILEAAQRLYTLGEIDRLVVICPAAVRGVWCDPEFGEIRRWYKGIVLVTELHNGKKQWGERGGLRIVISNYEQIRFKDKKPGPRLVELMSVCSKKTMLVLDESYAIKNYKSLQTKGCMALRQKCGRVVLLNGLPIANSIGDLYSQANIMSPSILACKNWFQFRGRYAVLGGFMRKQIVAWKNVEDIQNRLAPYVLSRTKDQLPDLPPKLPAVTYSVPLSQKTWSLYKEMKEELVAKIDDGSISLASHAAVKVVRLGQITSGFLGGMQEQVACKCGADGSFCLLCGGSGILFKDLPKLHVSKEKREFVIDWCAERWNEDRNLKLIIWSRFRDEVEALIEDLNKFSNKLTYQPTIMKLIGGQKEEERSSSIQMLDPRVNYSGPCAVVGVQEAGSVGLNLSAAHHVLRISSSYSNFHRLQAEDRVHRPGQTKPVFYGDVIATGPNGQKTVDHIILRGLKDKQDISAWTMEAWRSALSEE